MSLKHAPLSHFPNFGEKFTQKLKSFYINPLEIFCRTVLKLLR